MCEQWCHININSETVTWPLCAHYRFLPAPFLVTRKRIDVREFIALGNFSAVCKLQTVSAGHEVKII